MRAFADEVTTRWMDSAYASHNTLPVNLDVRYVPAGHVVVPGLSGRY